MLVLASSVVRSTRQGDSHGGVYLVDVATGGVEQVLDWNEMDIDWAGRGLDRGLRGIAFHRGQTLIAASDEIFSFDRSFNLTDSFRSPYLRHCHEIHADGDVLWLASTGFDSVLGLDLATRRFCHGICLRSSRLRMMAGRIASSVLPSVAFFEPSQSGGPEPLDTIHLNSVFVSSGALYCAGTRMKQVLRIQGREARRFARVPWGTHNARPYRDGVLMNCTAENAILYTSPRGEIRERWELPVPDATRLVNADVPRDHARPRFGRGLCTVGDETIIAGSSPATVSVYEHGAATPRTSITLSHDVRNAIHGLEVYPYT